MKKPNPKAELVESFGAQYISAEVETPDQLAARVGNIDLVYEGIGVSQVSFDVLRVLGQNGIFIFTGIPAPGKIISVAGNDIMRNIVLKNQAVVGTVNADRSAFQNAIRDLGIFIQRWPEATKSLIIGPCRVLELQSKNSVSVDDLKLHNLQRGERILLKTANSTKSWALQPTFDKDFIYISRDAAQYIVDCGVRTIGVDYLSVGGFYKDGVETHHALLGAEVRSEEHTS